MKPTLRHVVQAGVLVVVAGVFDFFGQWQRTHQEGAIAAKNRSSPSQVELKKSSEPQGRTLMATEAASRFESALAGNYLDGANSMSAVVAQIILAIRPSEIPALVTALDDMADDRHKQVLITQLAQVLAENDPVAALTIFGQRLTPNSADFYKPLAFALDQLAKTDMHQAINFLTGLRPGSGSTGRFYQTLFQVLGESDPVGAKIIVENMPTVSAQSAAINGLVLGWIMTDPQAALDYYTTQRPDEVINVTVLAEIASSSPHPFVAAQYISAIQDETIRNTDIARVAYILGGKDPATTMDWLNQVATGDVYSKAVTSMVASLTKNDPADAALVLDKITDPGTLNKAIETLAGSWGNTNPQAALTWVQTLPTSDTAVQSSALISIVASWSKNDPNAVAAYVQNSADPSVFLPVDPALAQSLAASNPQAALAFAGSLPASEARNQALDNVLVSMAKTDFASAWTDAAALPATDNPVGIMTNLVGALASKDPAQAAGLIAQFPAGTAQDDVTSAVAATWIKLDPQAFTVWLTSLPPGDVRDTAIAQLVSSSQATKNPAGVLEWVNTVSNPRTKAALVQQLNQAGGSGE